MSSYDNRFHVCVETTNFIWNGLMHVRPRSYVKRICISFLSPYSYHIALHPVPENILCVRCKFQMFCKNIKSKWHRTYVDNKNQMAQDVLKLKLLCNIVLILSNSYWVSYFKKLSISVSGFTSLKLHFNFFIEMDI